jgi:hypothetical protein
MSRVPEGYRKDHKGNLVPEANIREIVKQEDELVNSLIEEAKSIAGIITDFKTRALAAIDDHQAESARQLKAKVNADQEKQRSKTLWSFDHGRKVKSTSYEFKEFDGRLSVAKGLFDKVINRMSETADPVLVAIVEDLLDVNSGTINGNKMLALKKYEVPDPDWKKAMEAASQALTIVNSKRYVLFYEYDENGAETRISLNIAQD